MALIWKTNYTNKEGQVVDLKYAQVYLIGKNMDLDEEHIWVLLGDKIQEPKSEYGKYSLFMKKHNPSYTETEPAFIVELSTQLYNQLVNVELHKFDVIRFWCEHVKYEKTGVIRPKVAFEILNNPNAKTTTKTTTKTTYKEPVKENAQKSLTAFAEVYKEVADQSIRSVSHFLGSYMMTSDKDKQLVEDAEKVFQETMVTEEDLEE